MALEFRIKDERYTGPTIFPNQSVINQASVFVDHLPSGFTTAPYKPYLVNDRYSHRPRYVIDIRIVVDQHILNLLIIPTKGQASTNPGAVEIVATTSIEKDGLDLLLMHLDHEYQGTLYPIPELTAEARRQHFARQRHRDP